MPPSRPETLQNNNAIKVCFFLACLITYDFNLRFCVFKIDVNITTLHMWLLIPDSSRIHLDRFIFIFIRFFNILAHNLFLLFSLATNREAVVIEMESLHLQSISDDAAGDTEELRSPQINVSLRAVGGSIAKPIELWNGAINMIIPT